MKLFLSDNYSKTFGTCFEKPHFTPSVDGMVHEMNEKNYSGDIWLFLDQEFHKVHCTSPAQALTYLGGENNHLHRLTMLIQVNRRRCLIKNILVDIYCCYMGSGSLTVSSNRRNKKGGNKFNSNTFQTKLLSKNSDTMATYSLPYLGTAGLRLAARFPWPFLGGPFPRRFNISSLDRRLQAKI